MSSDRGYTDSETRLLACYKALQEIKAGKRKPNSAQPEAAAGSKQARHKDPNPGISSAPLTSSTGQKLPSRIRLKAARQPGPAVSGEGGPSSPSAPTSPAGQASAEGASEAAAAAEPEQQPQATISRQELAALLRRKKLEQSRALQVDPLLQRTAEEEAAPAANTAADPAPAVKTVVPIDAAAALASAKEVAKQPPHKAVSRAKLPLPGAPKTPKAAIVGPSVQMAEAIKPPAAAAAAAAPAAGEIDYGAVSSPEYEVDYDAVSSPEYDAVSAAQRGHLAPPPPPPAPPAAADAADEKLQPLLTPERHDGGSSSSSRHAASPAAAALPKPPLPPSGNDAKATLLKPAPAAADATPTAARRRSGSRSCSRSRSPAHRRSRGSSRQRSAEQRWRSSKSRSRSPSRGQRRSGSRRQHRSRSRSRGRGSWQRRASPDYKLGARRTAGSSPSSGSDEEGSPPPRTRRQSGSRPGSRQGSRQPQQHPTLFVGDLPPVGFSSADLQAMFSGHGWSVLGARVMGSQCYGFVEFEQQTHAHEALALVSDGDPRFAVNGGQIRASWARGSMPDWKRGKAVMSRRDSSQGLEGLEAYEHPLARMLRLQAAAAAAQAMAGVIAAEMEPEEGQVAGPHHVPAAAFAAVRPVGAAAATRALVDYGDL